MTAAQCAGLPEIRFVTVKEFAAAAGLAPITVRRRISLWESNPAHPRAIPYNRHLGKPYRIPAEVAVRILTEGAA